MLKRVLKRARRKEEEEALGLDGDMEEAMGMHDTDSEESDSEPDSDGEGTSSASDNASQENDSDDEDQAGDSEQDEEGSVQSNSDDDASDEPPMSAAEAVENPIYIVSLDPELSACVMCPGKLLKNTQMANAHLTSNAHKRRHTKFVALAKTADIKRILKSLDAKPSGPAPNLQTTSKDEEGTSKRALKRKKKIDVIKAKRDRQKVKKAKARQAKSETEKSGEAKVTKSTATPKSDKSTRESVVTAADDASAASPIRHQSPPAKKRKTGSAIKTSKALKLASSDASRPLKAKKDRARTDRAKLNGNLAPESVSL